MTELEKSLSGVERCVMLLAEAEAEVVQERAIVDALLAHAEEHERLLMKAESRVTLYRGFLDEPTEASRS